MKISIWIPKEKDVFKVRKFLENEVQQAENIKSKETRNATKKALGVLRTRVDPGSCIYTNGHATKKSKYDGKTFFYRCGKEYFEPEKQERFT